MSEAAVVNDQSRIEEVSEALAEVFRAGVVGDVFTDDIFLDGHPPFWRFQIQGLGAFADWLAGYVVDRATIDVIRTIATADGFVTEHVGRHVADGTQIASRKLLLCAIRGSRIAAMTVYCSGDWDAELQARQRAEAPMVRP